MKKHLVAASIALASVAPFAHGGYLYDSFLAPSGTTDFLGWYNFSKHVVGDGEGEGVNDPRDVYLDKTGTGSGTLAQLNPGHTILGSDINLGRIYSHSDPSSYVLAANYSVPLGSVGFQFQTIGTLVDFENIRLKYESGGQTYLLSANEYVREYTNAESPGYGSAYGNRSSLQWDLSGLNIKDFEIVWTSQTTSMSLSRVLLDMSPDAFDLVPKGATFEGSGSVNWGSIGWKNSVAPQNYSNVAISNSGVSAITLDSTPLISEIVFKSAHNVTVEAATGQKLRLNTGLSTSSDATGVYTINTDIAFETYQAWAIKAGEVIVNGVLSGTGTLWKTGNGKLVLKNDNTFGMSGGNLAVDGGIVRIEGTNAYSGLTSVEVGTLEVAANAGTTSGALGTNTANMSLGLASASYAYVGAQPAAELLIDGDYTISKGIVVASGTFEKIFSARNTTAAGATFAGNIFLTGTGTDVSSNVIIETKGASDLLKFTGNFSAGNRDHSNVYIRGAGTVEFSGNNKSYHSNTHVSANRFVVGNGTTLSGSGTINVKNGATMIVNGTLGNTNGGSIAIESGGRLSGAGTVNRTLTVGSGAIFAPGDGIGTISTVNQTWAGGGILELQLGAISGTMGTNWDGISITGDLSITADAASKFTLKLSTINGSGESAALIGFDPEVNQQWQFVTTSGSITGDLANSFLFDATGFANPLDGSFFISSAGKNLYLNYQAIPEPSTYLLLTGGALAYGLYRRRVAKTK